ncbi:MAG: DUF2780 domain-containing protein [Desulfobacterales bacterium]
MKRSKIILAIAVLVGNICAYGTSTAAMSDLISMLMTDNNVTEDQATAGAGAVFGSAKEKMSPMDFAKVSDALPGIDSLISAVPNFSKKGNSVTGGVSSLLGGAAGSAGSLAGLADTFSNLGMDSNMVGKFVDTILQFTNSEAGAEIANLLKSALL